MSDEINVIVVKRKGHNLFLRYTDPVDGKRREKNSGTTSMKAAQRAAAGLGRPVGLVGLVGLQEVLLLPVVSERRRWRPVVSFWRFSH